MNARSLGAPHVSFWPRKNLGKRAALNLASPRILPPTGLPTIAMGQKDVHIMDTLRYFPDPYREIGNFGKGHKPIK